MKAAAHKWTVPEIPESEARALARRSGVSLPAARVLWVRGVREEKAVEHFLHPKLSDLFDPFLLLGMERAVERVRSAIRAGEKILVYGDYDTDGVTSVVILSKMLERLNAKVTVRVPDRIKEGYGMQEAAIVEASSSGVTLIISVDTGIRANEAVDAASAAGIDIIITDHHLPEAGLPKAYAILNPNQPGCSYPNKGLCGAGVTFKLIQALMHRENWPPSKIVEHSNSFLMMVAIATVADIVPLVGENRVIVSHGLDSLRKAKNPGLLALIRSAGFKAGEMVSAGDVAFRLSPRINAAGRMRNAADVVEMFLTSDEIKASSIADHLNVLNVERRETEERIVKSILSDCATNPELASGAGLVFSSAGWHRGVVGIVASRLVEAFHRPVLVLTEDPEKGIAQGSGRSTHAFHLLDALEEMSDLLIRFGGHKHAAGLTLEASRVGELRERFQAIAAAKLSPDDLAPTLALDAPVRMEEINDLAVEDVLRMAPFGLGNPAPRFLLENVTVEGVRPLGEKNLLVKFSSAQSSLGAKAWSFSVRKDELQPGMRVDAAVRFEEDAYSRNKGYAGWAAVLLDVRPAAG